MRRGALSAGRHTLLVAAALVSSGCYQLVRVDDPDGSVPPYDGGRTDGPVRPDAGPLPTTKCLVPAGVDLLLVVDDSNSMEEEQQSLAVELPSLVRSLIEPPDDNHDGEPDWLPIPDLQVGVVTTDMGTGGFIVPTCPRSDFGDDGILRTVGNTMIPSCAPTYPRILAFDPRTSTPDAFAADVACVARPGVGGCGFEQPFEAMLKALAPASPTSYTGPSYVPPTFLRGTTGHGLDTNSGFVRDDSLLAVVLLSDEEDCSALDPDIFNPESVQYAGDLNLRCHSFPEALHPLERYVDGLFALRPARSDLIAFALIGGLPVDLAVTSPSAADFSRVLEDPRMQEVIDPLMPNRLTPSCDVPGHGLAFPPRRGVEIARQLGPGRVTLQSICNPDLSGAASAIARLVGQRACRQFQ